MRDPESLEAGGPRQQAELSSSDFPMSSGKPKRVFNKEVMVWVFRYNKTTYVILTHS